MAWMVTFTTETVGYAAKPCGWRFLFCFENWIGAVCLVFLLLLQSCLVYT